MIRFRPATLAMLAILGLGLPASAAALPTAAEIERGGERFLDRERREPAVAPRTGPSETPLAGSRVLALYGAPQMGQTILGLRSPEGAARRLASQSLPYERLSERPLLGAFDLVSVFATAGGGPDGLYRTRQDDEIIAIYLEQARAAGARLMLDIQPGRSSFLAELRELREWVLQPDVDVALDPEWNVGRRGIPGRTPGKVSARKLNRVSGSLARTIAANDLPPKLLVVHQFREGSIRARAKIKRRESVHTVLNFDGIGSPAAKASGYAALSSAALLNGFSLFYRRDEPLMEPDNVLALLPEPDFLLYQ